MKQLEYNIKGGKKIVVSPKKLIITSITVGLLMSPNLAFAQTVTPTPTTDKMANLHSKCDSEIDKRLIDLNKALTRINSLKKLSSDQKAQYSSEINTDISGLTSLKAKCDADIDLTTLRSDYNSIFTQYRIYAVFLPQIHLLTASDTMGVTADQLSDLANKLQTRISQAGNPSNLTSLLSDMQAKIADSKTQYSDVESQVTPLTPQSFNTDPNGTKNILKNAHQEINTGAKDENTAWQDAKQIRDGLKSSPIPTP